MAVVHNITEDPGGSSVLSLILFNIVTFKIESISDIRVWGERGNKFLSVQWET